MKIQILGTGCKKCQKLFENAQTAANNLNIEFEMVKIEKIEEISSMGVFMTPALAIDDDIKASGKILTVAEIESILK